MANELIQSLGQTGTNPNTTIKSANAGMGKDDFLKLLVTQLSHQDPLNPVEDKEFIAQMAQFSTLEQIQNLNKNVESLVGETNDLMLYMGQKIMTQLQGNSDKLLESNKEIIKELSNLSKAIKEYGLKTE